MTHGNGTQSALRTWLGKTFYKANHLVSEGSQETVELRSNHAVICELGGLDHCLTVQAHSLSRSQWKDALPSTVATRTSRVEN